MPVASQDISKLLGLPKTRQAGMSAFGLMSSIAAGLPLRSLDTVADLIAPMDAAFKYRIVPKPTLARRKKQAQAVLSPEQGEKLARIAEIWAMAMEIWQDADDARLFLIRPHPLLEGQRPLDLALASDMGARLVRDVLNRGRYGCAA